MSRSREGNDDDDDDEEEEFEEVTADDDDEEEYDEIEILSESGHPSLSSQPSHLESLMDEPDGVYREEVYSTDGDREFFDDDDDETQSEERSLSRHTDGDGGSSRSGSRSTSYQSGSFTQTSDVMRDGGASSRTDFTPSSRRSDMESANESSDFVNPSASFRSATTTSSQRTPTSAGESFGEDEEDVPESLQTSVRSQTSASTDRTPTSYSHDAEQDTNYNSEARTASFLSQSTAASGETDSRRSVSSTRRSYTDTNHSNRSASSATSSRRSHTETNHSQRSVTSGHSRMSSIREQDDEFQEFQESTTSSLGQPPSLGKKSPSSRQRSLHLPDPSAHSPANGLESVSTGFRTTATDHTNTFSRHIDDHGEFDYSSRTGTSQSSSSSVVSQDVSSTRSGTSHRSGSLSNRISGSRRSNVDKNDSVSSKSRRTAQSQRSGMAPSSKRSVDREQSSRSASTESPHQSVEDGVSMSNRSATSRSSTAASQSRKEGSGSWLSSKSFNNSPASPGSIGRRSAASSATPASASHRDSSKRQTLLADEAATKADNDEEFRSATSSAKGHSDKLNHGPTSTRQSTRSDLNRPQQVEASYSTNGEYSHHDGSGKKTQSLAVLGTMSDAGKSVIAAAICRILVNGGTRVAPFKAQNMSNNASPALLPDPKRREILYKSFEGATQQKLTTTTPVSKEGYGEIGTAQSLQAEACKIVPRVEMNPVLLKSGGKNAKGEHLCSVVVLGKQIIRETYGELQKRTSSLRSMVLASHHALSEATGAEVIVMEGAGSCTELNLMERDIVNLPLVRSLNCPWLLVANIDCGGVFAQIVGTKMCVPERDWDLCVGVIVNKLKGEAKYFEPGPTMLERMVGKPIFVVPFLNDLNLPEEDGLGIERRLAWEKDGLEKKENKDEKPVVVVVAYPHTAIADDLCPLEQDERFHVEWRRQRMPKPYPSTTAVVLPGSRLTMMDLKWLIDSGWADFVRKHRAAGGIVVGLCGGYQMLGRTVTDPEAVEGIAGSRQGVGLLPISTTIAHAECKVVQPRKGQLYPSGIDVEGFELHCGFSQVISDQVKLLGRASGISPLLAFENGKPEGMRLGMVCGTYLHGIFRSEKARVELLIPNKKHFPSLKQTKEIEDPLDRFANHVSMCGLNYDRLQEMIHRSETEGVGQVE